MISETDKREVDAASAALEAWIQSQDMRDSVVFTMLANVLAKHTAHAPDWGQVEMRLAVLPMGMRALALIEFKNRAKTPL